MTGRARWLTIGSITAVLVALSIALWRVRASRFSAVPAASSGTTGERVPDPIARAAPTGRFTPAPASAALQPAADEPEQLLRQLEQQSATDKLGALARALEADTRLPESGVMAEARRALIVTLLVDTGDMAAARARTRDFIQRYPDSRYRRLVQGVTGIHPRPSPSSMPDARAPP